MKPSLNKPVKKRNYKRRQDKFSITDGVDGSQQNKTHIVSTNDTRSKLHEEGKDEESCIICTDTIIYAALSPCNHKTCHKCTFRQRALYNKRSCLVCRTENDHLIFTPEVKENYSSFKEEDIREKNDKYGILFTSEIVAKRTLQLLKFTCPFGDVGDLDYGSYEKLNEHLKISHNRTICMICTEHKKAFPIELPIITLNQLKSHQSKGDSKGFKGHPLCGFCVSQRFYSDDELYTHMRDHHEKCHVCDQIDSSQPQYFKNYSQLFEHFKHNHFICTIKSCLDSKFVVFRDDLDLQAHILKEHKNILNTNKNNVSIRKFRSELSTLNRIPSRITHNQLSVNTSALPVAHSANTTNSNTLPEVVMMRMKERAKHYLNQSATDFEMFLSINNDFKNNKISAAGLNNAYRQLFTSPDADIDLLLYNLSELYPEQSTKRKELRAIYDVEQRKKNHTNNFPTLSSLNLHPGHVVGGSWSNKQTSKSNKTNKLNFPSLKSNMNQQVVHNKTSSSQTAKKSSAKPFPIPKGSTNILSTYTPTYLKNNSEGNLSQPLVTSDKFPSLSAVGPKKFRAPPVNQPNILDPSKWGKVNRSVDSFAINDTVRTTHTHKGKKPNKSNQLLLHIGI